MLRVPLLLAACVSAANGMDTAVIVLTSNSQYPEDSERAKAGKTTGWYLPEAVHPYWRFRDAGFRVVFASVDGGHAPVDPGSMPGDDECARFWDDAELRGLTENTVRLSDIDEADIDVILFAGGFGVMWDFPEWGAAHDVIRAMYRRSAPVGGVCHGPIVFANVKLDDGTPLVSGKDVTAFTNQEEHAVGMYETVSTENGSGPGSCEDVLSRRGGKFKDGGKWQANVASAHPLYTGQNPASASPLAEAMIKAHRGAVGKQEL